MAMDKRINLSITVLAIIVVGLALAVDTYGSLYSKATLNSSGTIITTVSYADNSESQILKVYSDSACTTAMTAVNWGYLSPGDTTTKVVYLKNTGNTPLTLSLTTANWSPTAAASSLVISWDKQATVLAAGQSIKATMTLSVAPSTSGITSFSTQIIISGTSQ
jgi:hypothetical protein